MTSSEDVAKAYDALAPTYEEVAESNPYNAHLEFPAMTSLLPAVAGKRILDAGCGAGRYVEYLLDREAEVVGVDVSESMIEQTRHRVDNDATLHVADLTDSLAFASANEFDGIVSSLTLDYIEGWNQLFDEFSRIIQPNGFLVVSVRHPVPTTEGTEDSNYFDVELIEPDYEAGVPYYRRPISQIFTPLLEAGFRLDAVVEPRPDEQFREEAPDEYEHANSEPVFLCIRAWNATG